MSNPLLPIQIKGTSLTRNGRQILDDMNLTIGEPGISVVMGPNGAGKSLLLRAIHGLITPDKGEIRLAGHSVSASRTEQAMVFQHPVLLRRTALQNLRFACPEATLDACQRALHSVNLADRADSPARKLSGGEQQRLALARACMSRPRLLLLDEATASLDPASVYMIETLVKQQRDMGCKVILVSHDQGQAKRMADEVIFIAAGQIVEQTPADRFFKEPTSTQAKAYLSGELLV